MALRALGSLQRIPRAGGGGDRVCTARPGSSQHRGAGGGGEPGDPWTAKGHGRGLRLSPVQAVWMRGSGPRGGWRVHSSWPHWETGGTRHLTEEQSPGHPGTGSDHTRQSHQGQHRGQIRSSPRAAGLVAPMPARTATRWCLPTRVRKLGTKTAICGLLCLGWGAGGRCRRLTPGQGQCGPAGSGGVYAALLQAQTRQAFQNPQVPQSLPCARH